VPNPDSRVSLAETKDALGLPKIRLDWRLTEQDRRSVFEHIKSVAMEFGALGIGRTLLNIIDDGEWPTQVGGGSHHMGTTRMHQDPRKGVVDSNCKVHGVGNLYIAGSSVFPTAGAANPTLSLVALTLRLADHLRPLLR
jgi:choline dehydrogenase-like flavoprotein